MRHTFTLILIASVLLAGCSREGADWTAAQSANTIESYQEFVKQHPDSAHGLQAQTSINQLTEDRDWQQAAAADTREAYEQFVAAHADSKWAQEARVRVENLAMGGASTGSSSGGAAGPSGPVTPEQAQSAAAVPGTGMTPQVAAQQKPAAAAAMKANTPAMKPAPAAKPAAGSAMMAMKPSGSSAAKGGQLVQLGSFGSHDRAAAQWKTLVAKVPSQLKAEEPRYETATVKGKSVVRLQTSVSSAEKARELCAALKTQGQPCLLVQH